MKKLSTITDNILNRLNKKLINSANTLSTASPQYQLLALHASNRLRKYGLIADKSYTSGMGIRIKRSKPVIPKGLTEKDFERDLEILSHIYSGSDKHHSKSPDNVKRRGIDLRTEIADLKKDIKADRKHAGDNNRFISIRDLKLKAKQSADYAQFVNDALDYLYGERADVQTLEWKNQSPLYVEYFKKLDYIAMSIFSQSKKTYGEFFRIVTLVQKNDNIRKELENLSDNTTNRTKLNYYLSDLVNNISEDNDKYEQYKKLVGV